MLDVSCSQVGDSELMTEYSVVKDDYTLLVLDENKIPVVSDEFEVSVDFNTEAEVDRDMNSEMEQDANSEMNRKMIPKSDQTMGLKVGGLALQAESKFLSVTLTPSVIVMNPPERALTLLVIYRNPIGRPETVEHEFDLVDGAYTIENYQIPDSNVPTMRSK
jgi:hypothetical protein